MLTALPQMPVALACFTRIQDFLTEDDKNLRFLTIGMQIMG